MFIDRRSVLIGKKPYRLRANICGSTDPVDEYAARTRRKFPMCLSCFIVDVTSFFYVCPTVIDANQSRVVSESLPLRSLSCHSGDRIKIPVADRASRTSVNSGAPLTLCDTQDFFFINYFATLCNLNIKICNLIFRTELNLLNRGGGQVHAALLPSLHPTDSGLLSYFSN